MVGVGERVNMRKERREERMGRRKRGRGGLG